tara:strand:+ start:149 stop:526 length:378 start_codon:yes stop_codon:yes gene_type:complete
MKIKKVLIDTNAWMAVSEFKIDIFSELRECCNFKYQIYVLEGTLTELEKIRVEQRGKYKLAASLAIKLIEAKEVKVLPSEDNVDDLLVLYSKKDYLVLTQDVALKRRLTKPYLTIRQKKKIMLVN